jgi:flagellar protein FlaG
MDLVNTRFGLNIANEKDLGNNNGTRTVDSVVGLSLGPSPFAKSENSHTLQHLNNTEKVVGNLPNNQVSEKHIKDKELLDKVDTIVREENVSFAELFSDIGELLQTNGIKLSFSIDNTNENSAKRPIVIVSDKESGNIIRQIPSEEVQRFAERLNEIESGATSSIGLMLDRQA